MPAKMTIKRSDTEPTADEPADKGLGSPTKLRGELLWSLGCPLFLSKSVDNY